MESNEIGELREHAEEAAHDRSLVPITFTMSVLAVLVATVSLLGHRAHTDEVLTQSRTSDEWAYYQAKNIRKTTYDAMGDLLAVVSPNDREAAAKLRLQYKQQTEKWAEDLSEQRKRAEELQHEVGLEQRQANRFDFGEALLEIALVVTSITLLTRQRAYWLLGLVFGLAGLFSAGLGFAVR